MEFYQADPTLENYWRGVILFGRNVASYKFALASALYEVDKTGSDLITLDQLAVPFSRYLCEHLKHAPKQITSRSSQFLETCLKFNRGEITHAQLIEATVRLGFNNVIDAFHYVNQGEIDKRFFLDERKTNNGIRLTDNFFLLGERLQYKNLAFETNARWNLVEQAWSMGISRNLVGVEFDEDNQLLFTKVNARRVDITSCRDSLNGYQKGRCFYCFKPISLVPGDAELADVDHFIPWAARHEVSNINGVWNLVLACRCCNRGVEGKSARIPELRLLQRLHTRNEYFIQSKLPLNETIVLQTGQRPEARRSFLQRNWQAALDKLIHTWKPNAEGEATF
ncbi:HNH endonuclease domain-containing protein [Enterobacter sp. WCHEn090032]|uniref:HNH endonuclease domain-containing protein n=1 Tax=Enterobacter sp. WCHEn090032 TaxID=2497435 RepID=UPI000F87BA20|nr:HNH endonuclease domain-containing protein [Enterobacter sp. WCHEn090032]RTN97888.1 HNH endonuclease [Enterobacter sp. WCHEn090032]